MSLGAPFTSQTLPGHERDLGPAIREIEWAVRKDVYAFFEKASNPEAVLSETIAGARRHGLPASSAWYEGETIVIAIERPRGFG